MNFTSHQRTFCRNIVESIGKSCGYGNAERFARAFKHETGLTPTQFRRRDRSKNRRNLEVSEDGLEQLIIYGQGAIRMTARELWNEVQAVETELREKFIENRPPKNNILADHLDEESLAWFEALRRQK